MSANNPTIIASLIKEHTHVTRKPGSTPASVINLHIALYDRFGDNRIAWRNYFANNPDNLTDTQLNMLRKYRRRVKGCMYVRNFRRRKTTNTAQQAPGTVDTGILAQAPDPDVQVQAPVLAEPVHAEPKQVEDYSTIISPGTSGGVRFVTNTPPNFTDLELLSTVAVSK